MPLSLAIALAVVASVAALAACDPGPDCDPGTFVRGADLSGADLAGRQLQACDLSAIDLTGADLHGANLALANLQGSDLHGADLTGANLSYASLVQADLGGARLAGATVTGANLTDAVLGAVTSGGLIGTPGALPAGWAVVDGSLRATSIPAHQASTMTDDPWYRGAGPKVVVLGDSLTNSIHDQLHGALLDHASAIVSMPGEGFAGGNGTQALGSPSPVMALRAATYAATGPAVAVVALGTNDASNPLLAGTDPMPYAESIFGSFADACTVGVLIVESVPSAQFNAPKAVAVNNKIRALADVVVDWRLHALPGDIDWDGVHLTPQGQAAYTNAIHAGIDACAANRR